MFGLQYLSRQYVFLKTFLSFLILLLGGVSYSQECPFASVEGGLNIETTTLNDGTISGIKFTTMAGLKCDLFSLIIYCDEMEVVSKTVNHSESNIGVIEVVQTDFEVPCNCGQEIRYSLACIREGQTSCIHEDVISPGSPSCEGAVTIEVIEIVGCRVTYEVSVADDCNSTSLQYSWSFGDGNVDPERSPTPTHTYASDGEYRVTVQLFGGSFDGCSDDERISLYNCTECIPDCDGRECGSDGCQGSCGECSEGCINGNCEGTITPDPDGSGSDCGFLGLSCIDEFRICEYLLILSILLLLAGTVLFILVNCANRPDLLLWAIYISAAGVLLFGLWYFLCRRNTLCEVIQGVHCIIYFLITIAFPLLLAVVAIISRGSNWKCYGTVAAAWGGWGFIYALLVDVMDIIDCVRICTLA